MKPDDDRLLEALARLPLIQPEMEWEARVRTRCRSAISKRASRRTGLIGLAAATALCIYFAAILAEAARLAGLLL